MQPGVQARKKKLCPITPPVSPAEGYYILLLYFNTVSMPFLLSAHDIIFFHFTWNVVIWTIKALGLLVMHFALDNFFVLSILVEGVSLCLATVINNINGEFKIM